MKKLADDCFVHDKDRMKHSDAINLLRERMAAIASTEELPLEKCAGRILAANVTAPRDIPAFDNSAVDGYAFAFSDHEPTGGFFPIAARIPAGETSDIELPGFSAARIFTGARMPTGADTIAMQEDCEIHEQDGVKFVIVPSGLKKQANCRLAGEDVKSGDSVASMGTKLRPQDLAAIASTGTPSISVYKPLKIGMISSGDEILRPGETYAVGQVYDANHFMLKSLLEDAGAETMDIGVAKDNSTDLQRTLRKASEEFDVILSTGGASKGEEDHFVNALDELGKCHLWQLAVKPGRPMSFGQIGDTPCFTLPGNPVAAFVCFLLYVKPSLQVLGGGEWQEPQCFPLPAGFSIKSKPDRREFLRGFIETSDTGEAIVKKFDRDGSGLISGLQAAGGLIEVAENQTEVSEGSLVDFIPFSEFGIN